jgi:hypothetical protein
MEGRERGGRGRREEREGEGVQGSGLGERGSGRNPPPHLQSSGANGRADLEDCPCFPPSPWWVSGCVMPLDPSSVGGRQEAVLGTRFSASGIPDTAGHLRRAENRMPTPPPPPHPRGGVLVSLWLKGGEGRWRTRWFPRGRESLVQPVAGMQEGYGT